MPRIQYINDETGAFEEAHGSDSRFNVSSRADSRSYYSSRDDQLAFAVSFQDADVDNNDLVFYFKNTSNSKIFVIDGIGVNSSLVGSFYLGVANTVAATGGSVLTPVNLNLASPTVADASVRGGGAIGGTAVVNTIDSLMVGAFGHEEFRLDDRLRLGQNDAILLTAANLSAAATANGVVFGFYE